MNKTKQILNTITITVFIIAMLFSFTPYTANAQENSYSSEKIIERFSNGDYITSSIEQYPASSSRSSASKDISGQKVYNYRSNNGTILWTITCKATFSYNGKSSSCTSVTASTKTYSSLWTMTNKKSHKSDNTATATATGKRYSGHTVIQSVTRSAVLKCSASGKLS